MAGDSEIHYLIIEKVINGENNHKFDEEFSF